MPTIHSAHFGRNINTIIFSLARRFVCRHLDTRFVSFSRKLTKAFGKAQEARDKSGEAWADTFFGEGGGHHLVSHHSRTTTQEGTKLTESLTRKVF